MESTLQAASNRWAEAERNENAGALEPLLVDEFTAVGPRGYVLNKAQWLARYESGDLHNESWSWQAEQEHDYGTTRVVVGRWTQDSRYQGNQVKGQYRVTQVWIERDGDPRLAAIQLSEMAPAE